MLSNPSWPHAPLHELSACGTYFVTAGTYRKPNHYHFVGHPLDGKSGAENLSRMLGLLHENTAKWINRLDETAGRKVWHNFWETRLTHQNSYLARLNYVHQNPVKHGLVVVANQYPWCSAGWFERTARPAQVKTIYGFKTDRLKVLDDYDVMA